MALRVVGTRQLREQLAGVIGELRDTEEIVVTQRGQARAVLVDIERYNQLLERLEFLEDSIDALGGEREGAVPIRELT